MANEELKVGFPNSKYKQWMAKIALDFEQSGRMREVWQEVKVSRDKEAEQNLSKLAQ